MTIMGDDTLMMETPTPGWVHEWLNIPFYEETPKCSTHQNKYLTVYCGTCSGNLFCEVCWKTEFVHHHAHPTVQVCIASHRAAVEKNAIKSVVDTSDIQDYIINHKKVVYLKPNFKAPPLDQSDRCRTCQRKLRDQGSNFCSIACKVGMGQCSKNSRKKSCETVLFESQNALVFEKVGTCREKRSKMMTKKRKRMESEEKMMRRPNKSPTATTTAIPTLFLKTKTLHRRKGIPHRSPFF